MTPEPKYNNLLNQSRLGPGWVTIFITLTVLLASFIFGYARLVGQTEDLRSNQESFLRKETWEMRNRFIDERLAEIKSDIKDVKQQNMEILREVKRK